MPRDYGAKLKKWKAAHERLVLLRRSGLVIIDGEAWLKTPNTAFVEELGKLSMEIKARVGLTVLRRLARMRRG